MFEHRDQQGVAGTDHVFRGFVIKQLLRQGIGLGGRAQLLLAQSAGGDGNQFCLWLIRVAEGDIVGRHVLAWCECTALQDQAEKYYGE